MVAAQRPAKCLAIYAIERALLSDLLDACAPSFVVLVGLKNKSTSEFCTYTHKLGATAGCNLLMHCSDCSASNAGQTLLAGVQFSNISTSSAAITGLTATGFGYNITAAGGSVGGEDTVGRAFLDTTTQGS
jgi:hypothetical protein